MAEVIRETDDTSSLVLDVPPALAGTFAYSPGQFITVRVPSDQTGSVARCYSLCSSPQAGDLPAITVKRTAGGYASNRILDTVAAGTVLDLLPPAGTFCPSSLDGDFLLFAAGSGITPVISILKSVLAAGRGRVALMYANRDDRSVIFGDELRKLAASAGGRWSSCTGWTRCRGFQRCRGSPNWPGLPGRRWTGAGRHTGQQADECPDRYRAGWVTAAARRASHVWFLIARTGPAGGPPAATAVTRRRTRPAAAGVPGG